MPEQSVETAADPGGGLRAQAVARVKARRGFQAHAFIYVLVNVALIASWAVMGTGDFFWPIFPILGWGIGLAANAWAVFYREPISEQEISAEEQRIRERGTALLHQRRPPP